MNSTKSSYQLYELETLLHEIVNDINSRFKGDGCSIFLREESSGRYILRDSTVMNSFIGNYSIKVDPGEKEKEKCGITKLAILREDTVFIDDIEKSKDKVYRTYYNRPDLEKEPILSSEVPHHELKSFIAIPLRNQEPGKPNQIFCVIRIVRKKTSDSFSYEDSKTIKNFIHSNYLPRFLTAMRISYLFNFGSTLDLEDICKQSVEILKTHYNCRSCTIFLYNGEKDSENSKKYQCFGTTGLWVKNTSFEQILEKNIRNASYSYNKTIYEKKDVFPDHLAIASIHYGINIITNNLETFSNEDFKKETGLDLCRKEAKYYGSNSPHSGQAIFIPLYTSRFDTLKIKNEELSGKRDVFGLIVITLNEELSQEEIRYVLSFTKKISKILLFGRFLELLSKPITDENQDILIEYVCDFSGSRRAAIYKVYDSGDQLQLKIVREYGDTPQVESYAMPRTPSEYTKGLTNWVACTKHKLIFNDIKEIEHLKEIEYLKDLPQPKYSGESTQPDRFVGIPICYEKNVLGVLRTAKSSVDPPFNDNEILLFKSLAERIAPYIHNWNRDVFCKKERIASLKATFGETLLSKIKDCASTIDPADFYNGPIKKILDPTVNDKSFNEIILEVTHELWEKSGIIQTDGKTLSTLKKFDDHFLNEFPGYRDHFIHQFQVFLLGYYIIKRLEQLHDSNPDVNSFYDDYFEIANKISKKVSTCSKEEKKQIALNAWLITSTFHDIAFPVQKIQDWLGKTLDIFFEKDSDRCVPDIPIQNIFFNGDTYVEYFNDLVDLSFKLKIDKNHHASITKARLQSIFLTAISQKKDHGILSSFVLRRSEKADNKHIILPSALAIALHKEVGNKMQEEHLTIDYSKLPLFAILCYCDLIHEWGRENNFKSNVAFNTAKKNNPILHDIIVTNDPKNIPFEEEQLENIDKSLKKVYIFTDITIKDEYKFKECKDWLHFINSKDIHFCVRINGKFVPQDVL